MEALVWIGVAITLAGLAGLVLSIGRVRAARRAAADDADLRARLQRVLPLNLGAFFLSVVGLMAVVLGLALG